MERRVVVTGMGAITPIEIMYKLSGTTLRQEFLE